MFQLFGVYYNWGFHFVGSGERNGSWIEVTVVTWRFMVLTNQKVIAHITQLTITILGFWKGLEVGYQHRNNWFLKHHEPPSMTVATSSHYVHIMLRATPSITPNNYGVLKGGM